MNLIESTCHGPLKLTISRYILGGDNKTSLIAEYIKIQWNYIKWEEH